MRWYTPQRRPDCGGRFATEGIEDEKLLIGGMATSYRMMNRDKSCFRILGRVFGEPRRHPRYATWDDPQII